MSLSRKRSKALRKLRRNAEELWSQQQDVLTQASAVAREARKQATHLAKEKVGPGIQGRYEQYVLPGAAAAGKVARAASEIVEKTVVPAVGTALGTALSVVDVAKDQRVHAAIQRATRKKKAKSRVGTFIVVGLAAVTVAGVAYAVWQTFRTDDDLWVSDDDNSDTGNS